MSDYRDNIKSYIVSMFKENGIIDSYIYEIYPTLSVEKIQEVVNMICRKYLVEYELELPKEKREFRIPCIYSSLNKKEVIKTSRVDKECIKRYIKYYGMPKTNEINLDINIDKRISNFKYFRTRNNIIHENIIREITISKIQESMKHRIFLIINGYFNGEIVELVLIRSTYIYEDRKYFKNLITNKVNLIKNYYLKEMRGEEKMNLIEDISRALERYDYKLRERMKYLFLNEKSWRMFSKHVNLVRGNQIEKDKQRKDKFIHFIDRYGNGILLDKNKKNIEKEDRMEIENMLTDKNTQYIKNTKDLKNMNIKELGYFPIKENIYGIKNFNSKIIKVSNTIKYEPKSESDTSSSEIVINLKENHTSDTISEEIKGKLFEMTPEIGNEIEKYFYYEEDKINLEKIYPDIKNIKICQVKKPEFKRSLPKDIKDIRIDILDEIFKTLEMNIN